MPTNSNEVAELFLQYPTRKSQLCAACDEWYNPYYKAIADTVQNYPVCSFMVYTREHANQEDSLQAVLKAELKAAGKSASSGRSGILSAWHCPPGQPNTFLVYKEANSEIGTPHPPKERYPYFLNFGILQDKGRFVIDCSPIKVIDTSLFLRLYIPDRQPQSRKRQ